MWINLCQTFKSFVAFYLVSNDVFQLVVVVDVPYGLLKPHPSLNPTPQPPPSINITNDSN